MSKSLLIFVLFLGFSIASYATDPHMQQIDLGKYQRHINVRAIDFGSLDSFTQIQVSDGMITEDLTKKIKDAVSCPFIGYQLVGIWISNLHWERGISQDTEWVYPVRGFMNFSCQQDTNIIELTNYDIVINLNFKTSLDSFGLLRIVPNSATIQTIQVK